MRRQIKNATQHQQVAATRSTDGVGRFRSFGIKDLEMVDQTGASWNQIAMWLRQLDSLRAAA
jgi:hypothetical protein